MSFSAHKISALFRKDLRDTTKNPNVLFLFLLPVLFTALYRYMNLGGEHMDPQFVMALGLLMALSLVPISCMSMMIAEEKEKNTLRTLMLSNVSAGEFLFSKSLLIYLISQAVNLLIFLLTNTGFEGFARFFLVTTCTCVCMMLFGASIGIISRNQMSTGMLSAPFMLVMLMPAIFGQVDEGIASVARFTPTYATLELIGGAGGLAFNLAVILGWAVLAAALFGVVYRRKRLD